jgi:hypothetical protein
MQASVNLHRHREGAAPISAVEEDAAHDANSTVFNAFTSIGEVLGPIVGAAAVGHFTQVDCGNLANAACICDCMRHINQSCTA